MSTQSFADFGLHPQIVSDLAAQGILHPFPIQAETLPIALARKDIIGQAKTGTGKTLGFGLPLLQNVISPSDPEWTNFAAAGKPQALVITPTRELTVQVAEDLVRASRSRGIRITQIYGGRAFDPQIKSLQRGTEVVVGTPGRILDLIRQRHLDLSQVKTAVLDEADEMLDLGFLPDVESILAAVSPDRHTMLFSATMPGQILALARRYMRQPLHIRAQSDANDQATVAAIKQFVYRTHNLDKIEVLARILQAEGRGLTIVFARTRRTADAVASDLTTRGFAAGAIHGDLGQGARERALRAFKNGKIDVLVATDVAARGIDVDDVTHVVNYQCPEDENTYLHRVGRTGRAGKTGIAVTFVDWEDVPRWGLIAKSLGLETVEPVETYSSSPHLFTDMDIAEKTTGRLPRSMRTRDGLEAEIAEDLSGKKPKAGTGRSRRNSDGPAQAKSGSNSGTKRNRQRRRTSGSDNLGSGSGAPTSTRTSQNTASGGESAAALASNQTSTRKSRPRRRTKRIGEAPVPRTGAGESTVRD